MGGVDIERVRLETAIEEGRIHIMRINEAFERLQQSHALPLSQDAFNDLLEDSNGVMLVDQVIYRFSKAQDVMGAKLFRTFMSYQQEEVDRPFRDILNDLEKLHILKTDDWAELRQIRNKIAHDYAVNSESARTLVNDIYKHRNILGNILNTISAALH
jgi:hypothetical protein